MVQYQIASYCCVSYILGLKAETESRITVQDTAGLSVKEAEPLRLKGQEKEGGRD